MPPNTVVFRQDDNSSSGIYIVVKGSLGVYLQERTTKHPVGAGERGGGGGGADASGEIGGFADGDGAPVGPPFLTNILREGESVGDVDVLDNAPRGVSVIAMQDGATLVRVTQAALMTFIKRCVLYKSLFFTHPSVSTFDRVSFQLTDELFLYGMAQSHPRTLQTYLQQAVARLWRVAHFVLVDFLGLPRGGAGDAVRVGSTEGDGERDGGEIERKEDVPAGAPAAGAGASRRASHRASPAASLLRHLPALERVCARRTFDPGEALYHEGDDADAVFLLLSGVARADAVPWPAGNGARGAAVSGPRLIGGSAFLTRSPRQETLRVATADELVDGGSGVGIGIGIVGNRDDSYSAIPKGDGSSSSSSASAPPCVVLEITHAALDELRASSVEAYVATLLATSCALSHLLREFISLGLNRVWLSAGECAFERGEEATSMFVLISGRIRLTRGGDASTGAGASRRDPGAREERGRGETIGEAPLLGGGRYASTAMCLRDTELVRMSRGALTLICARNPTAASRLLEAMARKLHDARRGTLSFPRAPDVVTIALVPASAGRDDVALASLAQGLRWALEGFGKTLWLDEMAARGVFPDDDRTMTRLASKFYRSKLTAWMAQQEERYRFIVLQTDASASPWSQVCVSQADRVIVVAHADAADATPRPHEEKLLWRRRRGATTELVLVHAPGCAPRDSKRWRACRPSVARHHPLRVDEEEDLSRLARHVAGHAVGVVLTGGGGHGLAHLGALRALEDAGVPVDVVGGTSQGALVAALYAAHASTSHMLPQARSISHWSPYDRVGVVNADP